MRLFVISVLSLLALGSGTYAAAVVGYPYRAELLAYNPARGEFAPVNTLTSDYVNSQAAAQLFGYKYPEPIQSRRITYEEYLNQLVKGTLKDETEQIKKRDEHFRLWAVQVYDQYRQEVERLKAAGQEPSADTLAKLNAFEVVLTAPKNDNSQDTSIIKQLREEHLRFWNESRRKAMLALQQEAPVITKQTGVGEALAKPITHLIDASEALSKDAPTQAVFLSETAEQKKAREEHLRIYQEQVQRVEELQAAAEKASDSSNVQLPKVARNEYTANQGAEQQVQGVTIVENLSYLQETPEVQRAKAEHLRLWNEAKLRAEKQEKESQKFEDKELQLPSGEQQPTLKTSETPKTELLSSTYLEKRKPLTDASNNDKASIFELASSVQKLEQLPTPVQETPEVQRARAEHLRVLEELLKKAEFVSDAPATSENKAELPVQSPPLVNEQSAAPKSAAPTETTQSHPETRAGVQETAEVQRAREEHLKLVKEAHLKASQTSQTESEPKPALYEASADKIAEQSADEEARLRAEETKQREAELLAETERLRGEKRLQAEELLRLQQEEQRRQEQERLDQAIENKEAEHNAEKPQLPIATPAKETLESLILSQYQTDPTATHDIRDMEKYTANPYLLRYAVAGANANQVGAPIATTAYYLGAQQKPAQQQQSYANPGVYYLRDANEGYLKLDNPYFLHYITNKQGGKDTLATADAASLATALAALHQVQKIEQPLAASFGQKPATPFIPIAPLAPSAPLTPLAPAASIHPVAPLAPSADNMKILYGNEAALAALEQATREHFRAHELALEQLRLANQKQPLSQKDCY